ncbi:hypothetical protein [Methylobacterium nonmethylotrophicum]|uniref:Uncharacterized protein n=1 Tax=Methylobacterium nonmethylotrophicum TaxID=1141884 RepID=A0A4Z0NIK5_9HYPH|nr:hypothetical protein [Methylobacterium nonmethylotrophicum]TGD95512.1 hypothetical protein EU555_27570 [Methylobacterium nonmethylotrophicum]
MNKHRSAMCADFNRLAWTDAELDALVSVYLADPSLRAVIEMGGKRIDVAAAVMAQRHARAILGDNDATMQQKRLAVRAAILVHPIR